MADERTTTAPPADPRLVQARQLVRDLFTPQPRIYWSDFLFHAALGWAALAGLIRLPFGGALWAGLWVVAVLALYRAVIFIHELAHLRPGALPGFRIVWNLLCGIPLLAPSFTYSGVHNHHHKQSVYATAGDGEYLAFGRLPHWVTIGHLALSLVLPFLVLARFVLLTPLGWLSPRLARFNWERASSLTIDFRYRRGRAERDEPHWRWQETSAFVWGAALLAAMAAGRLPWKILWCWYAVLVGIFVLNGLRTLAAHRYRHDRTTPLGIIEQFHDSVDVPGRRWLTPLWAPVGLRFHATHHLFPGMPYHHLATAHQRLTAGLDDPRWYLASTAAGLWPALADLWRGNAIRDDRLIRCR